MRSAQETPCAQTDHGPRQPTLVVTQGIGRAARATGSSIAACLILMGGLARFVVAN